MKTIMRIFYSLILVNMLVLFNLSCSESKEKKITLGKEMIKNKKFSEAKILFNELIIEDSTFYEYFFLRAVVNDSLKDRSNALKDYLTAARLNKDCAECYFRIGMMYHWDSCKYETAVSYFTKAIEIKKNYYGAFIERGNSYQFLKQDEKAISDYNKAIQIYPDSSDGYFQRAIYFRNNGKIDNAIEDFKIAAKIDKFYAKDFDPYMFLLQLLSQKDNYNEVKNYASLGIKKFPKSSIIIFSEDYHYIC